MMYLCCCAGALWVCVVLNPSCLQQDKQLWHQQLRRWSDIDVCPMEDADTRMLHNHHPLNNLMGLGGNNHPSMCLIIICTQVRH